MTPDDRLAAVFDRGLSQGLESLTANDRELFRIQEFILDYEMGGLTSYFYNHLPDLESTRATISAMRQHRLTDLANLLEAAAKIFENYSDPDEPSTWGESLQQYDPTRRLDELHNAIGELDAYGIADSTIQ